MALSYRYLQCLHCLCSPLQHSLSCCCQTCSTPAQTACPHCQAAQQLWARLGKVSLLHKSICIEWAVSRFLWVTREQEVVLQYLGSQGWFWPQQELHGIWAHCWGRWRWMWVFHLPPAACPYCLTYNPVSQPALLLRGLWGGWGQKALLTLTGETKGTAETTSNWEEWRHNQSSRQGCRSSQQFSADFRSLQWNKRAQRCHLLCQTAVTVLCVVWSWCLCLKRYP